MTFSKRVLLETTNPYAPCVLDLDGEKVLVVAPVDHGSCYAFFPPYDKAEAIWDDSGTMNVVEDPVLGDTFYSTRRFFQKFMAAESYVSRVRFNGSAESRWSIDKVLDLPYLHRFNIVEISGRRFFIGCTLCRHKDHKDDWSTPGDVYAADITDVRDGESWKPVKIIDGIHRNHGYFHCLWKGVPTSFVGGTEGLFAISMVGSDPLAWPVRRLIGNETSDMVLFDLDGDGVDEIVTIEGFHGDYLNVYKETSEGFVRTYQLRTPQGHSLWAGEINGERVIIEGYCHEDSKLIMLHGKDSGCADFSVDVIDTNVGPRNFRVFEMDGRSRILSANWGKGEIALYTIE